MITETIQTEIWEDVPDKPGYVRHTGMKTIGDVFQQVKEKLPKELLDQMDYFMISGSFNKTAGLDLPWGRWISAYPVIGDNEGHYIHVDVIAIMDRKTGIQTKEREQIFTGKTFMGFDVAAEMSMAISKLFNDYRYDPDKPEIYARYAIVK